MPITAIKTNILNLNKKQIRRLFVTIMNYKRLIFNYKYFLLFLSRYLISIQTFFMTHIFRWCQKIILHIMPEYLIGQILIN